MLYGQHLHCQYDWFNAKSTFPTNFHYARLGSMVFRQVLRVTTPVHSVFFCNLWGSSIAQTLTADKPVAVHQLENTDFKYSIVEFKYFPATFFLLHLFLKASLESNLRCTASDHSCAAPKGSDLMASFWPWRGIISS